MPLFNPATVPEVSTIYDSTLAASASSFDVTGISADYRHLQVFFQGRSARAAQTEDPVRMRFNNDSGANYDTQYLQAYGNTETGTPTWSIEEQFAQTAFINLGTAPAASSPSGSAGQLIVDVANYAGTTYNKTITGRCSGPLTDSTAGMRLWVVSGEWRSTAAINRITIFCANADLAAGSRLTIVAF